MTLRSFRTHRTAPFFLKETFKQSMFVRVTNTKTCKNTLQQSLFSTLITNILCMCVCLCFGGRGRERFFWFLSIRNQPCSEIYMQWPDYTCYAEKEKHTNRHINIHTLLSHIALHLSLSSGWIADDSLRVTACIIFSFVVAKMGKQEKQKMCISTLQ